MKGTETLEIDGSRGEGGGQILRTALTLGLVLRQRLRFFRIREGRPKPGLRAQHVASLEAAAAISGARLEGARIGSREVIFDPAEIRPGRYRFEIGTAGAATLVIQTVAIPLSLSGGPSEVEVTGGTHVPWSPSARYLSWQWAPFVRELGFEIDIRTAAVGFTPRGGGRVVATIPGGAAPRSWTGIENGGFKGVRGEVTIAGLPRSIAERIVREARRGLASPWDLSEIEIREVASPGPGVAFDLLARLEGGRFATTSLGKRGLPAEEVARRAVEELEAFSGTGASMDRHLADQAVVPLCLGEGVSRFVAPEVTSHLETNAGTVALFLEDRVQISRREEGGADVAIQGGIP